MWFRYVDETFALFDDGRSASASLQCLKCRHNIKLTNEFEEEGEIPFWLDILVKCCPERTFMTSIYLKENIQ